MSYQGLCKAGSGGELTVTSWARSRPQEELLVWPCSVGQGSPRARHLLLLGKHRQLPLCLMPAQWDHAATWAGGNLHPQRPDSAGGPSETWQHPALEHPLQGSIQHLQQPGTAFPKTPGLAGEEARSRKPIFPSSSCTLTGRLQPGTTDLR